MKKVFVLFLLLTVFLVSCGTQEPVADENIQPTLTDSTPEDSQLDYEIHPIAESLFSGNSEKLTFDDIIKSISDGNMTVDLIDESRTDAKISAGDDNYYTVYSNPQIRISPLDTFIRILNECAYIEISPLNEPVLYTFIFNALDNNGNKNEICIYVTRSSIRLAYNGVPVNDVEYINIADTDQFEYNIEYKNVSAGYDSYINGIIPDENGQLATIW